MVRHYGVLCPYSRKLLLQHGKPKAYCAPDGEGITPFTALMLVHHSMGCLRLTSYGIGLQVSSRSLQSTLYSVEFSGAGLVMPLSWRVIEKNHGEVQLVDILNSHIWRWLNSLISFAGLCGCLCMLCPST